MSETPDDECARCGEVFDIPVGLDPSKYCNLCAQVLVEERGVSLAAAQSDLARLAKSNAELREALRDLLPWLTPVTDGLEGKEREDYWAVVNAARRALEGK